VCVHSPSCRSSMSSSTSRQRLRRSPSGWPDELMAPSIIPRYQDAAGCVGFTTRGGSGGMSLRSAVLVDQHSSWPHPDNRFLQCSIRTTRLVHSCAWARTHSLAQSMSKQRDVCASARFGESTVCVFAGASVCMCTGLHSRAARGGDQPWSPPVPALCMVRNANDLTFVIPTSMTRLRSGNQNKTRHSSQDPGRPGRASSSEIGKQSCWLARSLVGSAAHFLHQEVPRLKRAAIGQLPMAIRVLCGIS
jgi:hypothetical protein